MTEKIDPTKKYTSDGYPVDTLTVIDPPASSGIAVMAIVNYPKNRSVRLWFDGGKYNRDGTPSQYDLKPVREVTLWFAFNGDQLWGTYVRESDVKAEILGVGRLTKFGPVTFNLDTREQVQ